MGLIGAQWGSVRLSEAPFGLVGVSRAYWGQCAMCIHSVRNVR